MAENRVSTAAITVLNSGLSMARVSTAGVTVLNAGSANARVSTAAIMVLRSLTDDNSPGTGSLSFSGKLPTTKISPRVTPNPGALSFTGHAPTTAAPIRVQVPKGALAFTPKAPSVRLNYRVGASAITFTGHQPAGLIPSVTNFSQFGMQALVREATSAHISQFGLDALAVPSTTLRLSQYGLGVLAENEARIRISQMGLLVLAKGGTPAPTPSPLALPSGARSKIIDLRFVNMYYEQTPDGPSSDARFGRPGLEGSGAERGGGPVYAIFDWQGFQFTVSGDTVWRDDENIGTVNAGDFVKFATSETEIVIVTGGKAYYVTTEEVAPFTDFDIPDKVIDVLFSGGRFLYLTDNPAEVFFSAVGDARNIDGLNFFTAESRPDNLVAGLVLGNDIALFGKDSVDWFYPTGNDDAPFDGSPGRAYTKGLAATETLKLADNTGYFLGDDRIVYRMAQAPQRVSSYDVENSIRKVSDADLPQARAFSITFGGHAWYVLSLPGQSTWALDISQQKWSEWRSWNKPNFRVRSASGFFMGDQYTGKIMGFNAERFTDLDDPLERIVGTYVRHRGPPVKNFKLTLNAIRGVGTATGYGSQPVVEMRYSDNEGSKWTDWMEAPLGVMGHPDEEKEATWDQLGVVQTPGRLYEFRVTDPVEFSPYAVKYNEQY